MIKAVLFDFGGVLSLSGKAGSTRRTFGNVYGLDLDALHIDDLSYKMWRGQISDEDFLHEIHKRNPKTRLVTPDEFRRHLDEFERSEPVYALAEELRTIGVKTGILSNIFGIGVGPLRVGGFYNGFDPVILSCEVGLAKPDPAIYRLALNRLGFEAHEVIFIDDQPGILAPAQAMGMHTVLARNPEQIITDTRRIIKEQQAV